VFGAVVLGQVSGDYFPYDEWGFFNKSCLGFETCISFWTGFYSERPYLKKLSRETDAVLRAAEVFLVLARAKTQSKR